MARRFNGTSDYLEGSPVVTVVPATLACWFSVDDLSALRVLLSIGDAAGNTQITLRLTASAVEAVTLNDAGGGAVAATTAAPKIRRWQHACGTFALGSPRSAYLNGRHGGSSFGGVDLGTPTVTAIGARYIGGVRGLFMDGCIAEAAVWDVELGLSDVQLLGLGYPPERIRPGHLKAHWEIEGWSSPAELDRKGRFDLTVNGAMPVIEDDPPMMLRTRRHRALEMALGAPSGPTFVPGDQPPARIIFRHV